MITNQFLLCTESALKAKRNNNSSIETMPKIKYPLYENELSFKRKNNAQESISSQSERLTEEDKKLKDTIICVESAQCTVRKKERFVSNDAFNSEYVLSKMKQECSNLKSKDDNDIEVLLEDCSSLHTKNGVEFTMGKKPWKFTLDQEKVGTIIINLFVQKTNTLRLSANIIKTILN